MAFEAPSVELGRKGGEGKEECSYLLALPAPSLPTVRGLGQGLRFPLHLPLPLHSARQVFKAPASAGAMRDAGCKQHPSPGTAGPDSISQAAMQCRAGGVASTQCLLLCQQRPEPPPAGPPIDLIQPSASASAVAWIESIGRPDTGFGPYFAHPGTDRQ